MPRSRMVSAIDSVMWRVREVVHCMSYSADDFAPYIPIGERRPCSECRSTEHGAYITYDRYVLCRRCYQRRYGNY